MAHFPNPASPAAPLACSPIPIIGGTGDKTDLVILPRLAGGQILLIHHVNEGPQSFRLPILKNHWIEGGLRDPALRALRSLGIDVTGDVCPLGVLRAAGHSGLVVVARGCRSAGQCMPISISAIEAVVRAGEIRCEASLAALRLMCESPPVAST